MTRRGVLVRQFRSSGRRKSRVHVGLMPLLAFVILAAFTTLLGLEFITQPDWEQRDHAGAHSHSAQLQTGTMYSRNSSNSSANHR